MTIIQNRVKNKINYQTNFTDFPIIVEYCRHIKNNGKVKSGDVNKICGEKRAEISNWQASKSDSHAKITLLQYGLIELIDADFYQISELGIDFIKLFDSNNNYKTTGAKSFTGEDILNIYLPYRTKNSALNSLYQNQNYKIDNNSLNNVLTKQGYLGVSELDKFYLDFYNTKYNLEEKFLDDFPLFIKKEILEGEISDIKESNNNLIEFAYNYFYSNIYAFGFSEDVLSDNTSKKLSIKNHYLNKIKEEYFKNIFKKIDSNTTNSIQNMQLYTNKTLMTNAFKDYNYYAHLEFILEKEENVLKEQGMIIPPDTGI